MSLTLETFVNSRRYAFHVCGAVNFDAIRKTRTLRSAQSILLGTDHENLLRGRRQRTEEVSINGAMIQLRDHKPLIPANIEFVDSYSLEDFIDELNARVFLWAGTEAGPCESGRNHIRKYQAEGSVFIIRTPTRQLIAVNGEEHLEITFCNSGSARQNQGQRAKRGSSTFMQLEIANRQPGETVEITFRGQAHLPAEAKYAKNLSGPWLSLDA